MTFEYTTSVIPDSSLIESLWYNSNNTELVVEINGTGYLYSNVPESRFNDLTAATSPGREFQAIKRDFGPSLNLGTDFDVSSVAPERQSVGNPQAWTLNDGLQSNGTNSTENYFNLSHDEPEQSVVSESEQKTLQHTVLFKVNGGHALRSRSLQAAGVREAVESLHEAAAMLGIDVTVVQVVVDFE